MTSQSKKIYTNNNLDRSCSVLSRFWYACEVILSFRKILFNWVLHTIRHSSNKFIVIRSLLLPELKEKQSSAKKQTAKVYEGVNGLRAAFSNIIDALGKGDTHYFFTASKKKLFYKNLILFFRNYHVKRTGKGIKVKGLTTVKR